MKSATNNRPRPQNSLTLSTRLALHQSDDQTTDSLARITRARALAADPSYPSFDICRTIASAIIESEPAQG